MIIHRFDEGEISIETRVPGSESGQSGQIGWTHLVSPEIDEAEEIVQAAEERLAQVWRARLVEHIAQSLDRELRDGAPVRQPPDLQAANSVIRELAAELKKASENLHVAATVFRDEGRGKLASAAKEAAQRAGQVARNVLGGTAGDI